MNLIKKTLLFMALGIFMTNAQGLLYAIESIATETKHIYTIEYYLSAPLSLREQKKITGVLDAQFINMLQGAKDSETEENLLALLQFSQLYAFVHITDAESEKMVANFEEVRDMGLSYLKKHKSYALELELATFVNYGFPLFSNNSYQAIKITRDLASKTYRKNKNTKSALLMGISYTGGVLGSGANNNRSFAEKYFQEALELDQYKTYITYLSYIHLANLYFKSYNNDKAKEYLEEAKTFYPDGYYAYIVESFFEEGKLLF